MRQKTPIPNRRARIDSAQDPLVKMVRRLARARRRELSFLIEGRKLVEEAVAQGAPVETVLVSASSDAVRAFPEAVEVKPSLFDSLGTLETPDGVIAVAKRPSFHLEDLAGSGLVAVSDGIQDPGNLGALARVAEASGASGLVLLPGTADPFGPKAVRGSMGSVLRLPVVELEGLQPLRALGFHIAALVPRNGTDYRECAYPRPLAIVLGREGRGVEPASLQTDDLRVTIPMRGRVESLNVATAAAIVLYEATRRGSA